MGTEVKVSDNYISQWTDFNQKWISQALLVSNVKEKKSLLYTKWKWKLLSHVHSLRPHGLHSPWNFPGPSTGVGSLCLLQGIFPTQGYNPGLLPCRQILYQLSHQVSQFWPFLKKIGIFLVWTTFKVFYWIYYNIVSFLCFGFLAVRHVGS